METGKISIQVDLADLLKMERQMEKLTDTEKALVRQFQQLVKEEKAFAQQGTAAAAQVDNGMKGVLDTMRKMGSLVLGAAIAEQLKSLAGHVITTTAKFESMNATLRNTLGAQGGADAFEMLNKFASQTPYTLEAITESFIKLVNRGINPTEAQLTQLGDFASAMGKDMDMLVEALLDAQTGEFERLKEFGVKASKAGNQVTFSFRGVQTQVANTEEAIKNYILGLGNVAGISGAMAARSATLEGALSNLDDATTTLSAKIGAQFSESLQGAIRWVSDLFGVLGKLIDGERLTVEQTDQLDNANKAVRVTLIALLAVMVTMTKQGRAFATSLADGARALLTKEGAANKARAALAALGNAMKAIGIGALIYGITEVVGQFREWNKYERQTEEIQEGHAQTIAKMAAQIQLEKDKMAQLFATLKDTTKGTAEREDAMRRLNTQYGQYLPNQLSDINNLGDIEAAQTSANAAMEKAMELMARRQLQATILEQMADAMADISLLEQRRAQNLENTNRMYAEQGRFIGEVMDIGKMMGAWVGLAEEGSYIYAQQGEQINDLNGQLDYLKRAFKDNEALLRQMGDTGEDAQGRVAAATQRAAAAARTQHDDTRRLTEMYRKIVIETQNELVEDQIASRRAAYAQERLDQEQSIRAAVTDAALKNKLLEALAVQYQQRMRKLDEQERERNVDTALADSQRRQNQALLDLQQQYHDSGTIGAEVYEARRLNIETEGLMERRAILVGAGRDTLEVDKEIAEARLKEQQQFQQRQAELEREAFAVRQDFLNAGSRSDRLLAVEREYRREVELANGNADAIAAAELKKLQAVRAIREEFAAEAHGTLRQQYADQLQATNAHFDALIAEYERLGLSTKGLEVQRIEAIAKLEADYLQKRLEGFQQIVGALQGFVDQLVQMREAANARELEQFEKHAAARSEALDAQAEREVARAGDNADKRKRIEELFAARKEALEKEQQRQREALEKRQADRARLLYAFQKGLAFAEIALNIAKMVAGVAAQSNVAAPVVIPIVLGAVTAVLAGFTSQAGEAPATPFAGGTDSVEGGTPGKDSVRALLMPKEAVIQADKNRQYHTTVKTIRRGGPRAEMLERIARMAPADWNRVADAARHKAAAASGSAPAPGPAQEGNEALLNEVRGLKDALARQPRQSFRFDRDGFTAATTRNHTTTTTRNSR